MHTIKVPKEIKMGIHKYDISYQEHLKLDEGYEGCINYRTHEIKLDPSRIGNDKVQVLLHEVLHIINEVYRMGLDEPNIDRTAQGMAEFLLNNLCVDFDWSDIS